MALGWQGQCTHGRVTPASAEQHGAPQGALRVRSAPLGRAGVMWGTMPRHLRMDRSPYHKPW